MQGFGQRYVDAAGATLGTVGITANPVSRFITFTVPKATLGTPGPGWGFTVVLTGQEGFSADQARDFQPTPQEFQFGVCATACADPHCTAAPGTVPKADRRDHAGWRDAVDRARLHARSGRAVGRLDPVGARRTPRRGSPARLGPRRLSPPSLVVLSLDGVRPARSVERRPLQRRARAPPGARQGQGAARGGDFFWLDIHEPQKGDLEILREEFRFHPLSLEDSWQFNQRPKIDDYKGYVFLVVFGASARPMPTASSRCTASTPTAS